MASDPDPDPDADILELADAGRGDRAVRLLMQRHGTSIYRYVRKALRDDARADDVHQRVFIEAHRDLPRFARRSMLRTWLFAIARNRVLDAVKQTARAEAHRGETDGADTPDPAPSAGERIDDARLKQALEHCLDKLDPRIREAVLLRHQQGFTFEEMAQMCDEKAGTLQARVARAIPVLRTCIESTSGGAV